MYVVVSYLPDDWKEITNSQLIMERYKDLFGIKKHIEEIESNTAYTDWEHLIITEGLNIYSWQDFKLDNGI